MLIHQKLIVKKITYRIEVVVVQVIDDLWVLDIIIGIEVDGMVSQRHRRKRVIFIVIEVVRSDDIIGMVIVVIRILYVDEMECHRVIMELEHDGKLSGHLHILLVMGLKTIIKYIMNLEHLVQQGIK